MWTHRLRGVGLVGGVELGVWDIPGMMRAEHRASSAGVLTWMKLSGCGDSRPTAAAFRSCMCSLKAPWRAVSHSDQLSSLGV